MRKIVAVLCLVFCSFTALFGQTFLFSPNQTSFGQKCGDFFSFSSLVSDPFGNAWSARVSVTDATLRTPSTVKGNLADFLILFDVPNVRATVTIDILNQYGIKYISQTWSVAVGPAPSLKISGSDKITYNTTQAYQVTLENPPTGTITGKYNWATSDNSKMTIVSGQGSSSVSVKANSATGSAVLKVTLGTLSESKTISFQSTPVTMSISGDNKVVEGKTTTYTANYSNHTSSTVYNWTSSTGNLSVISGNGTNTITVRGAAAGSSTLKVTAGSSASATKLVEVTSSTTIISNEIIRTNKSFSNKNLQIYNVEVLDNAVVNFIAEELVHITPGFYAKEGTTVTIKATGSALRSSFASEAPQLLEVASEEYSLVSLVDNPVEAKIVSLKVYSLTGMLLYSSDTDFELSLLDLSDGIYIVERSYDNGEIKRKKSYLKKQ